MRLGPHSPIILCLYKQIRRSKMNSHPTSFEASSLLGISRFQNPGLHFPQAQKIAPLARVNNIHQGKDIIDDNAPGFIGLFLFNWQKCGLFFKTQSGSVIENDLHLRSHKLLPFDLLSMAQRVRLRLTQIIQYLHMVRRFHLLKIQKLRGQRGSQKGRRVTALATELILSETYSDWEHIAEGSWSQRRRRFGQENRQARRWLIAASRLSFGALLICGNQLEQKMYGMPSSLFLLDQLLKGYQRNKHSTEKQVVALAAHVAQKFPEVVETFSLLDSAARGFLNQDNALQPAEVEPIIARIEHHLRASGSPLLRRAFSPMDLNSFICLDEDSTGSSPRDGWHYQSCSSRETLRKGTQTFWFAKIDRVKEFGMCWMLI